jgi:hypothetical protein
MRVLDDRLGFEFDPGKGQIGRFGGIYSVRCKDLDPEAWGII